MLLTVEVRKRINREWLVYPSIEFNGLSVGEILKQIDGQDFMIKVGQGMDPTFYIVGHPTTLAEHRKKGKYIFFAPSDVLSLWKDTPILDIIWPVVPAETLKKPKPQSNPDESFEDCLASLRRHVEAQKKRRAAKRMKKAA